MVIKGSVSGLCKLVNVKMNFISGKPEDCISLPKLRDTLIRLEDTIIFGELLKYCGCLINIID
jgi:hypothetical protein